MLCIFSTGISIRFLKYDGQTSIWRQCDVMFMSNFDDRLRPYNVQKRRQWYVTESRHIYVEITPFLCQKKITWLWRRLLAGLPPITEQRNKESPSIHDANGKLWPTAIFFIHGDFPRRTVCMQKRNWYYAWLNLGLGRGASTNWSSAWALASAWKSLRKLAAAGRLSPSSLWGAAGAAETGNCGWGWRDPCCYASPRLLDPLSCLDLPER